MRNTCKCRFFVLVARLKNRGVLARSFACVRLVVLAPIQSRGDVAGLPPVRSHELVEAFLTLSPLDYDAAVCRRPYDRPGDQRLTGKRAEPIPDGRLERVAELVASDPSLDVDQLIAIDLAQHDPLRATAAASPDAQRDRGNRCAERLKLLPDRFFGQELSPAIVVLGAMAPQRFLDSADELAALAAQTRVGIGGAGLRCSRHPAGR